MCVAIIVYTSTGLEDPFSWHERAMHPPSTPPHPKKNTNKGNPGFVLIPSPHPHITPPLPPKTKHKGDPDFVLDCIDDAPTKAELLGYCSSKGLKVIASLGAGLKVRVCGMCVCMWCPCSSKGLRVIVCVCVWFRTIQAQGILNR